MNRTRLITSPGFLIALTLLLLNDFVLKVQLHNWLTGKLSDFAGLFAFPIFLFSLFPRHEALIYWGTATFFAVWKSEYSGRLVESINTLLSFQIGRTVDPTDLIALTMLPVACLYTRSYAHRKKHSKQPTSFSSLAVCVVSVFAFMATSTVEPVQNVRYDKDYAFDFSSTELLTRISGLGSELRWLGPPENRVHLVFSEFLSIKTEVCNGNSRAELKVRSEREERSTLRLLSINYFCDAPVQGDREKLLKEFETGMLRQLREPNVAPDSREGGKNSNKN